MKAIIENGKTYKVVSEKGAFTVCEDSKGKCKMFETSKVSIVEISELPKEKVYKSTKKVSSSTESFVRLTDTSSLLSVLENTMSAKLIIARIEDFGVEMSDKVKSILNQANQKSGRISEKQIYIIAKFMVENNISTKF